jgi:PqqD family protein of HPr-rel-A system
LFSFFWYAVYMTGVPNITICYVAEAADARIVMPLDQMTLIYQRRSGITHIVADPVPQILHAMGDGECDAALIAARLSAQYDLGDAAQARAVIAARLAELAQLGLVQQVDTASA